MSVKLNSSGRNDIVSSMRVLLIPVFLALFSVLPLSAHAADEAPPEALAQLRFDGIAYDSNNPAESIVMINSIALHQGDEYRGFKVEEISSGSIVMSDTASNQVYEMTPGDGGSNVQKAVNWDPLKKLAELKLPSKPDPSKMPANGNTQAAKKAASEKKQSAAGKKKAGAREDNPLGDGLFGKVMANHPMLKEYDETKEKIDKIKADRDKRDAELDKLFERPEGTPVEGKGRKK